MQQGVQALDISTLGVDDEVHATSTELASPFWLRLISEMLGKDAVAAVHAKFQPRTRGYIVELVGNRGFQKLRSYQLIAPDITSVGEGGSGEFAEKVSRIAGDNKNMVFVPTGEGLRIYHFRAI
jgi:hypothetical protein